MDEEGAVPSAEETEIRLLDSADSENVIPMERSAESAERIGGHLLVLRPDYTFRRIASMFRDLFEKRVSTISERRRRAGRDFFYLGDN